MLAKWDHIDRSFKNWSWEGIHGQIAICSNDKNIYLPNPPHYYYNYNFTRLLQVPLQFKIFLHTNICIHNDFQKYI